MNNIIRKTLGGLNLSYYLRHLVFGIVLAALFIFMMRGAGNTDVMMILLFSLSALLYPYSRFVYESIVGFIFGDNIFFTNAIFLLAVKFITMTVCFVFAVFIAPIGLLYLYYYHTKNKTFE